MSAERSEFYPKTVHVLFAVVLATSFPLASKAMIPIHIALEPDSLVANITLALSYLIVGMGWVGYARSLSRWKYQDTHWGFLRFAFDIVILFEYFYLLQIAQTEYVGHFPFVMLVLAMTYVASDLVKYRDQPRRKQPPALKRMRHTALLLAWTGIVAYLSLFGQWNMLTFVLLVSLQLPTDAILGITAYLPEILACTGLAIWHRVAKWNVCGGGGAVRTVRGRPRGRPRRQPTGSKGESN